MNSYLLAPILAWLLAQGLKYVIQSYKRGNFNRIAALYETGGMPSSHTAIVIALMVSVGVEQSIDSPVFAVATALAVIVIHDALQVRRASGEQGLALRGLLVKAKVAALPYQANGHTPQEVLAGAAVGAVSAFLTLLFL